MLDHSYRALGTLVVRWKHPPQRFDRLADHRNRRLESMRVVFRRASDVSGRAMQGVHHAVELGSDVRQLWKTLAAGERPRIGSLLTDPACAVGKAAQPADYTQQGCKGYRCHSEINQRCDDNRRGGPIRLAEVSRRVGIS